MNRLIRKRISRRTLLRGTGAALALPLLEAMTPIASAGLKEPPKRTAFLYMPNGVRADKWQPPGGAGDHPLELSPMLASLAPIQDRVIALSNRWNEAASHGNDGHYPRVAGWLCGTQITKTAGRDLNSGNTSVDQVLARHFRTKTKLPSLELGTQPVRSGVDGTTGYARVYANHISWSSPTTPVAVEIVPQLAFDRLFRTTSTAPVVSGLNPRHSAVMEHLRRDDVSVLDLVMDDAKSLRKTVSSSDRRKIGEYLESVWSIEQRITNVPDLDERWENPTTAQFDVDRPGPGIPKEYAEHAKLMLDLITLAFWTDSTRVASFMFNTAISSRNFSFLDGVNGAHHEMSHHQNDEAKLKQYERIGTWHVEQVSGLLQRMANLSEGESTLLDNTLVMFGSSLRDGNAHQPFDLPILLAGGGVRGGRHLRSEQRAPLCDLYVTMLNRVGVDAKRFADSNGALAIS